MKKRLIFLLVSCSVLLFAGCSHDDNERELNARRTILIYMAANNTLGQAGYDGQNLEMLLSAVSAQSLTPARILVYHAPYQGGNALKEIVRPAGGKAQIRILKNYPAQNSVAAETMREVLDDVFRLAPNASYGLILWSHASGWTPVSPQPRSFRAVGPDGLTEPITRVFGEDAGRYMAYSDLVATLPDHTFDFIIADVCFMGGAEEAYGLRNKADYMIASPAEVLGQGLPYDRIVGDLVAMTPRLPEICRKFYSYYNAQTGDLRYRTATTALYDLRQMDALAGVMRQVVSDYGTAIPVLDVNAVQRFDRSVPYVRFDLMDVAGRIIPATDPLLGQLSAQMARTVLYKNATPMILNQLPIDTYCGMSLYIPSSQPSYNALNGAYRETDWYKAVYPGD